MHICTYIIHLCRYLKSKFLSHPLLPILQCPFQEVTTVTVSCIHLKIVNTWVSRYGYTSFRNT